MNMKWFRRDIPRPFCCYLPRSMGERMNEVNGIVRAGRACTD